MRVYRLPATISRRDFIKKGTDARFREAIYSWVQSVDRLLKCRDAFGRMIGLSPSQFAVLMGVASQQEFRGVTIKALAVHVSLASTHVTTEVGRLERKGLVVKGENAADGRSVLVSLTAKGEREIARVAPVVREINDILFRDIAMPNLIGIRDVARRLVTNSDEAIARLHSMHKVRRQRAGRAKR